MEVGVAGEEEGTTTHLHIICPMAEFRLPDSIYGNDHRIEILFSSKDDQKADILGNLKKKNAVG